MVNRPEGPAQCRRQGEPDPRRPGGMSHGGGCQRGAAPDSTPRAGPSRRGHLSALSPAPAGADRYRPGGACDLEASPPPPLAQTDYSRGVPMLGGIAPAPACAERPRPGRACPLSALPPAPAGTA